MLKATKADTEKPMLKRSALFIILGITLVMSLAACAPFGCILH